MKTIFVLLLLHAVLLKPCLAAAAAEQAGIVKMISSLPECGLLCASQEVHPECGSLANLTCICTNESLQQKTAACVRMTCSPLDSIAVLGAQADLCGTGHAPQKRALLAAAALEAMAWVAVILRTCSRWLTMHAFEADDYIMMVAGVLFTVFAVLGQYSGFLAFGQDVWTVSPDDLTTALKLFYVDESFYITILALTKITLLLFLLRIFPQRRFRIAAWATLTFVVASNAIFLLMQIFQCWPVDYNWNGWKGSFAGASQCLNVNMLTYTAASFSIVHDLIILVLPLPLLWGLNVSGRNKVGIFIMFSLGIFILITSCTRLQYMVHFARSANPTWDYTNALLWSGFEVSVSMIVASLPAIRILLKRAWPRVFATLQRSSRGPETATPYKGSVGAWSGKNHPPRPEMQDSTAESGWGGKGRSGGRMFSLFARGDDVTVTESQLELGDRAKGDVQTDIGVSVGNGRRSAAPEVAEARSNGSSETGIHVHTTTTTMIDPRFRLGYLDLGPSHF